MTIDEYVEIPGVDDIMTKVLCVVVVVAIVVVLILPCGICKSVFWNTLKRAPSQCPDDVLCSGAQVLSSLLFTPLASGVVVCVFARVLPGNLSDVATSNVRTHVRVCR